MKNNNNLAKQEEEKIFNCKMFLSEKFYRQLNDGGKELFKYTSEGFCAAFNVISTEGVTLGNCVISFIEAAYIELNPKYQVEENTEVKCELYKTGKEETSFSALITIRYQGDKELHHELLLFKQRDLTDSLYSFELVGDQTMFAM